jgi:uncharacterized membrane protein YqjE
MKSVRFLLILAAFLIMLSSVLILYQSNGADRTPVYINLAAMTVIAVAVSLQNFKNSSKDNL